MTFHAQAIPFRRQRIGWTYRTTRDGVEERYTISVVLYADGEVLADALPAQGDGGTFTFRATVERRATYTGKVEYCLVWNGQHVYASRRLTDLLEISGNQAISIARAASDERYIKARAAAVTQPECPGCVEKREKWGGCGPSHDPSPSCRSGKRPHCTCNACY